MLDVVGEIIGGMVGEAVASVTKRWRRRPGTGLTFPCSMRSVSAGPAPAGLSRRWRTGQVEVDGHELRFTSGRVNGFRYPRRRPVPLSIDRIHFEERRVLRRGESLIVSLDADVAVPFTTTTGQLVDWALPLQRLETLERRQGRSPLR